MTTPLTVFADTLNFFTNPNIGYLSADRLDRLGKRYGIETDSSVGADTQPEKSLLARS